MGKLIHAAIASLDGYVDDEKGTFDWAMPDEEVQADEPPVFYASEKTRIERDLDRDSVARLKQSSGADLPDDVHAQLEPLDERRFGNGVFHLHYRLSV